MIQQKIILSEKIELQWVRTKNPKNVELQQNMKNVFQKPKEQKRERRERGEKSKDSKERERSKKTRQVLIHSLTPDHPPLAAITGR